MMVQNTLIQEIRTYIKERYGVEGQYPWKQYPENITFKEEYTQKWFALILPVEKKKLGILEDGRIFIMNVKAEQDFISLISESKGYCPAYHMNKQNWLTVFLDGSVAWKEIQARIDDSYALISDSPTKKIYEAVKTIPSGKVATYGQVAILAGNPKMARAVGNALHKNPNPQEIPCFRVVNAKGELSGEFAFGGAGEQARRLQEDGVVVENGKVDLEKYGIKL